MDTDPTRASGRAAPGDGSRGPVVGLPHLAWIPAGAGVGFGASFVFADVLPLPVDLYYLLYFAGVLSFLILYASRTRLNVAAWASRRLRWAVLLGLAGGAVLVGGVLARPGTAVGAGSSWAVVLDVVWRGLIYGTVDGLLLFAFPWVVAWRALGAEKGGRGRKWAVAGVAYAGILLVTTSYHLGYGDFRSEKVVQPNIGATIGAVPTLVSGSPVASPLSHVALHVAAVLHVPDTDLYLPPHREE